MTLSRMTVTGLGSLHQITITITIDELCPFFQFSRFSFNIVLPPPSRNPSIPSTPSATMSTAPRKTRSSARNANDAPPVSTTGNPNEAPTTGAGRSRSTARRKNVTGDSAPAPSTSRVASGSRVRGARQAGGGTVSMHNYLLLQGLLLTRAHIYRSNLLLGPVRLFAQLPLLLGSTRAPTGRKRSLPLHHRSLSPSTFSLLAQPNGWISYNRT